MNEEILMGTNWGEVMLKNYWSGALLMTILIAYKESGHSAYSF